MWVSYASEAAPGTRNEDYAAAGLDWAFVLDGVTEPAGVDHGCRHGVRWVVARLAGCLGERLSRRCPEPLRDILAAAIAETRAAHAGTCDPYNPDSPSTTVAMARRVDTGFDYLVLADSAIVFPSATGTVGAVVDDRPDRLPGGRPYPHETVRELRNSVGGFWVAGMAPEAAYHAYTGTVAVESARFALLSDGCTRLVEFYGHTWEAVWRCLTVRGPTALIEWVRTEERSRGVPWGKPNDDATALYAAF